MGKDMSQVGAVRDLVGRALKAPLLQSQQQEVLAELAVRPPPARPLSTPCPFCKFTHPLAQHASPTLQALYPTRCDAPAPS